MLLFDRAFQNCLEEILSHNFFRYRSWFEDFLYLPIGDGGGAAFKGWYLHITVVLGVPFDGIVLAHYNRSLGPLSKHITGILQLLLGATLKAKYSRLLSH